MEGGQEKRTVKRREGECMWGRGSSGLFQDEMRRQSSEKSHPVGGSGEGGAAGVGVTV